MVSKILTGLGLAVAVAGAHVIHEGAVRIEVDEYAPKGTHLHLLLPAAIIPMGLGLLPEEKLHDKLAQARPWLPTLRMVSAELARLPNVDLVEVRSADEHVRVTKRGALLVIDVQSPRQRVHVSFPLQTLHRVCRKLESLRPRS